MEACPYETGAKPVYAEVMTLFGLILTNAVALTLSQQQATTVPKTWLVFAYGVVALTVLGGFVVIMRAREPNQQQPTHAHEKGSIMFARVFFGGAAIVALGFVFLAYGGLLPGQTFSHATDAEIGYPQIVAYGPKKDKKGIVVPVLLSARHYPRGIPPQLNMEVRMKEAIAKNWQVVKVDGIVESTKQPMSPRPHLTDPDEKQPNKRLILLSDLKEDQRYTLMIHLHAKAKASPDELILLIQDRGVTVQFLSRDK